MQFSVIEVRPSAIEGVGVFAVQPIAKGTRIIEYTGERISEALACARYGRDEYSGYDLEEEPHFYLFSIDEEIIIDGAVNGSDARFINHSCAPNCEAVIEGKRVFIDALRAIEIGEELTFDYLLDIGGQITKEDRQRYACICGAESCRGTMLALPKPKKRKGKSKA